MGALLEREDAMATLDGLLAGVRASSDGRLVLVGGEAGVGKTALLRRFCDAREGVRILWGGCEPLRTPRPLGPFRDVAEATGGELEARVAGGARPHEVAAALLAELRRGPPTVLVVEDLQWADEATLDVMVMLAPRLGSVPALVVASYRDDEVARAEPLRPVLGHFARGAARLGVAPLSAAAVARLAEPHGVDGGALFGLTGGNPFFVVEALAGAGERLPDTVRDAVLARAEVLSEPARRLLDVVAVLPGQVEPWLLDALAGDVADRLDECLASGMLVAGRAHVAFRHELARLAIEAAMSPRRRLQLHRGAVAALTARGPRDADLVRLAHHAEEAGDADAVLASAPRAGELAAASGAHREAAEQFARALRFAGGLPPEARAGLLQQRADECFTTGRLDDAIAAQEEALACRRQAGDLLGEGDALRSLSRLLFFTGRTAEGEAVALQAVELLERLPAGHELAMAYGNLSQRRMVVEETEAAEAWGTRALELARRLGDDEAEIYALTNLGAAAAHSDRAESQRLLERARALAEARGLDGYAARARLQLAFGPLAERGYALAGEHIRAGLVECADRGLEMWRRYLLALRGRLELEVGRWDDAARSAGLVLDDPRSAPVARGWALTVLGLVRTRRGDGGAPELLGEAERLVRSTGELMRIGPVAAARGEAAWLAGDRDGVEEATSAALTLALRRGSVRFAGELAVLRRRAGLRDDLAGASLAEPHRLAWEGAWAEAAERWRGIGCPYEAALALADGDEPAMRRALEELQAMGAGPAAALVGRRLRERGVRSLPRGPRARTRGNPAGLTPRELEVLELAAEGLRDAQIAQRLVLSERTVNHHVSAILRKLGVRTRDEAGAALARMGTAADPVPPGGEAP